MRIVFIVCILFTSFSIQAKRSKNRSLTVFSKPQCLLGKFNTPFQEKLKLVQTMQKDINRGWSNFKENKLAGEQGTLKYTPKRLTYYKFRKRGYTKKQREFGFFVMTLFGEARNLSEKGIRMVAKVINNRRRKYNGSYIQTVTALGQFSAWFYTNQLDNTVMLCPAPKYHHLWEKVYKVAKEEFGKKEANFKSTHYFSPYNMQPRFTPPEWARGKHVVGYDGHIFIVNKNYDPPEENKKVVYLPKNVKKVSVRRGKIRYN